MHPWWSRGTKQNETHVRAPDPSGRHAAAGRGGSVVRIPISEEKGRWFTCLREVINGVMYILSNLGLWGFFAARKPRAKPAPRPASSTVRV